MDELTWPSDAALPAQGRTAGGRRATVVFNPVAGRRWPGRLDSVLALLEAAGVTCRLVATAGCGDAIGLAHGAATATPPSDLVIAAGGDGTVNEVVNGLMAAPSPPPLAILPLGTANVLAAEIGLPTVPEAIAAAIIGGRIVEIAVGRLTPEGRCFVLMAGAGFDAHVVAGVRPAVKQMLGKGAYVLGTLTQLFRFGFPRYRVTVDGHAYDAASVVVSRGRFYGGRYLAAPAARLDRAGVQVCLFETGGRLAVLRFGAALVLGRLPRARGYRIVPGRRVAIEGPAGDPLQADGDIVARLPVEIDLAPRRLRLIVP